MGEVIKREFKIDDIRNVEQRRIPLPGITEFPGNSPSALGNIIGAPTEATIPVVTSERPTFLKAFLSNLPSALGAALSRQQGQGESLGEGFVGGLGAGLQGIEEQRRTQFQQGLQQRQQVRLERAEQRQETSADIQDEINRAKLDIITRQRDILANPNTADQLVSKLGELSPEEQARFDSAKLQAQESGSVVPLVQAVDDIFTQRSIGGRTQNIPLSRTFTPDPDPNSTTGFQVEILTRDGRKLTQKNALPPGAVPKVTESSTFTTDEFGNTIVQRSTRTTRPEGAPKPAAAPARPSGKGGGQQQNKAQVFADSIMQGNASIDDVPPKGKAAVLAEINRRGGKIFTEKDRQQVFAFRSAYQLLDDIDRVYEEFVRTKSPASAIQLRAMTQGTGSRLARAAGEVGVLTDPDIQRALAEVPGIVTGTIVPDIGRRLLRGVKSRFRNQEQLFYKTRFGQIQQQAAPEDEEFEEK